MKKNKLFKKIIKAIQDFLPDLDYAPYPGPEPVCPSRPLDNGRIEKCKEYFKISDQQGPAPYGSNKKRIKLLEALKDIPNDVQLEDLWLTIEDMYDYYRTTTAISFKIETVEPIKENDYQERLKEWEKQKIDYDKNYAEWNKRYSLYQDYQNKALSRNRHDYN